VGIADTTPPNAVFDRLRRLGERVEREGRLPLQAGAFRAPVEARAGGGAAAKALAAADETFQAVQKAVLQGDHLGIGDQVHALLERGIPAGEILQRGMISAMEVIGERFKSGDVFIPEVLLSARAMNEALGVLEPHLAGDRMKGGGKILIGTVRGDLHDIGKNMVATMLRGVGFEIRDLGINIRMEDFVEQVAAYKPDILGLSALLTTTMPEMGRVIQALKARGLRDGVKVMVGGAPVNEKFARDIGADAYAADAGDAVAAARRLMSSEASAP
jgi:5-methyltetrahydrofolate--homocysteine methyltransferase